MTVRDLCTIVDIYGIEYILRQLAEESMELAHAALKLIRANRHETPDTLEDAMDALTEEAADVYVMLSVLSAILGDDYRKCVQTISRQKESRMVERLLGAHGQSRAGPAVEADSKRMAGHSDAEEGDRTAFREGGGRRAH